MAKKYKFPQQKQRDQDRMRLLEAEFRKGAVSWDNARRTLQMPPSSVDALKKRHPHWSAAQNEQIAANRKAAKLRAVPRRRYVDKGDADDGPTESFLDFRERYLKRSNFWFHDDAYRRIEASSRLIMLLPPEHAKTMVWSIEYATYKLTQDRNYRICVVQKSQNEAKKVIRQVQSRLSDHAFYERLGIPREEDPITVYGGETGFKPVRADGLSWGAESFYLLGVDSGEKDPSMQAKGTTSTILGNRLNLLILDDIQDTKNYTPEGTETLMNTLRHDWISRMGEHGKIIMLGSRLGPGDIYERVMDELGEAEDRDYGWPIVKYPAVLNETTQEVLAPDLWSWEGLLRKRFEAGEKWWTNWMMADIDPEGVTFSKEEMRAACTPEHILGEVPRQVSHIYVGVDPAIRGHCGIITWGLDKSTGRRYLIDIGNERGLGNWDVVTERVVRPVLAYGARRVVVETNNTQGDIYDRISKAIASVGARAVPYQTMTSGGARAEELDFDRSTIAALYSQDLVSLPYGDEPTREKVNAFITQCCTWRAGVKHQVKDMLDANLFAESEARAEMRREHSTFRKPSRAPRWAFGAEGSWPWSRPRQPIDAA